MAKMTTPALGYVTDIMKKITEGFEGTIDGFMGGGRKASKTTSMLKFRASCLFLPIKIKSYISRYEVGGATETFAELLEHLEDEWLPYLHINKTERTIKHVNGNELRVIGYKSNQKRGVGKLGIKRGKTVDLVSLDIDEIYEFKNRQEVQDIVEALGSGRVFWSNHMTNTWTPSHWRLAQAIAEHAQDPRLLKEKGEDFKLIENSTNKIKYSHYTNHRINVFLPETEHQKLIDLHKIDPRRAMVADLGMFGIEVGGIYSAYMENVTSPHSQYIPHEYYIGIDVGIRRDATTAVLMSVNRELTQICFHNEYYFSDAEQSYVVDGQKLDYRSKTQEDRAVDIIKFAELWINNATNFRQDRVSFFVDYASSFNEDLQRVSRNRGQYWVNADLCIKPKIKKRVDLYHYLMANKSFFLSDKMVMLRKELELSKYDENQEMKKEVAYRLDGRDHTLNASEYALSDVFWDILDNPRAELYR